MRAFRFLGTDVMSSPANQLLDSPDDSTSARTLVSDHEVGDDLALVDGTQRQKAGLD